MARYEKVELFEAADGWRWRKRAVNGEITQTGEAYTRRESAEEAVRREFPDLTLVVLPSAPEQPEKASAPEQPEKESDGGEQHANGS
jgi:uncharacterized protein YegP (UPF0339 family)